MKRIIISCAIFYVFLGVGFAAQYDFDKCNNCYNLERRTFPSNDINFFTPEYDRLANTTDPRKQYNRQRYYRYASPTTRVGQRYYNPGSRDTLLGQFYTDNRVHYTVDGLFFEVDRRSYASDKDGNGQVSEIQDYDDTFRNMQLYINGQYIDHANSFDTYRGRLGVLFDNVYDIPAQSQILVTGVIDRRAQNGDRLRLNLNRSGFIDAQSGRYFR